MTSRVLDYRCGTIAQTLLSQKAIALPSLLFTATVSSPSLYQAHTQFNSYGINQSTVNCFD
ncbi:MAG: hypothetical protein HC769_36350 [Cyanobacteria bacterium CRU_2_1]|nr:hypothetical protein [Cyanobacteria bacterium CRU_2_1]